MNMLAGAFALTARMWLFAVAHLYMDVCEKEKNEALWGDAHIEPARPYHV